MVGIDFLQPWLGVKDMKSDTSKLSIDRGCTENLNTASWTGESSELSTCLEFIGSRSGVDNPEPILKFKRTDDVTDFLLTTLHRQLDFWLVIGLLGQTAFMGRFLVQWIASERAGFSHIPVAFWYLSIGGSLILLIYSIARMDIVFISSQCFGLIVYIRNLILIKKNKNNLERA